MTLIIIHCNDFDSYNLGTVQSSCTVLMKVYTVPCHDSSHMNVMLVVQSCTDSLTVVAGSSTETLPTPSDGTLDIGNIKVEEDLDMQEGEEEMNVKTEKGNGSEEEECKNIKDDEGLYSEEEMEDIDIKEEKDVDVKEEVS